MLDNFIIVVYLLLVLITGVYHRSRIASLQGYGNVDRKIGNNKVILLAAIFATSVGGGTTFGISEKAFAGNLSYSYGLLLTVFIDILIARYIVPQIVKFHGCVTVGDIMESHYRTPGKVVTGIAAFLVSIGYLAAQISVSARIFEYFLSINYYLSVIISYIVVIIYTTIGGLRSVVFTDILQFFLIIISIPIILIIGIQEIGGVEVFINNIDSHKYLLTNNMLVDSIIAILSFSVMGLHPTFIQKVLMSTNAYSVQIAIYRKIYIYVIFIGIITLIGLAASILVPSLKSNHAIPYLIDTIIPTGFKGLVVSGLLASVMSTADSDLNVASVSIVNDILKPLVKINNQKTLLIIAQIATVLLGSFAIIIALHFHNVVDLVIFVAGFWSPMLFVPLIATLYGIRISILGFVISALTGIISFAIWEMYFIEIYKISGVFIGTCFNLIVFISMRYMVLLKKNG